MGPGNYLYLFTHSRLRLTATTVALYSAYAFGTSRA
jgi:hypothetical protein